MYWHCQSASSSNIIAHVLHVCLTLVTTHTGDPSSANKRTYIICRSGPILLCSCELPQRYTFRFFFQGKKLLTKKNYYKKKQSKLTANWVPKSRNTVTYQNDCWDKHNQERNLQDNKYYYYNLLYTQICSMNTGKKYNTLRSITG